VLTCQASQIGIETERRATSTGRALYVAGACCGRCIWRSGKVGMTMGNGKPLLCSGPRPYVVDIKEAGTGKTATVSGKPPFSEPILPPGCSGCRASASVRGGTAGSATARPTAEWPMASPGLVRPTGAFHGTTALPIVSLVRSADPQRGRRPEATRR
jgi:hypothetical protein